MKIFHPVKGVIQNWFIIDSRGRRSNLATARIFWNALKPIKTFMTLSTYFAPVKASQSDNQLKSLLAKLFFLFNFSQKSCRSHQLIDFCCCASLFHGHFEPKWLFHYEFSISFFLTGFADNRHHLGVMMGCRL